MVGNTEFKNQMSFWIFKLKKKNSWRLYVKGNWNLPQLSYQQRMHKTAQHFCDHPKQMLQYLSNIKKKTHCASSLYLMIYDIYLQLYWPTGS